VSAVEYTKSQRFRANWKLRAYVGKDTDISVVYVAMTSVRVMIAVIIDVITVSDCGLSSLRQLIVITF